jgi:hypothetical protein
LATPPQLSHGQVLPPGARTAAQGVLLRLKDQALPDQVESWIRQRASGGHGRHFGGHFGGHGRHFEGINVILGVGTEEAKQMLAFRDMFTAVAWVGDIEKRPLQQMKPKAIAL